MMDNDSTNPLFDHSNNTENVLEMLDNDEILKSMWPIVKEYSNSIISQKEGPSHSAIAPSEPMEK
jgi:hypothetical protein